MGLLKKFGAFLINFTIFFLIVTFSPGLPPKTTFPFEEFSVVKAKSLTGALEVNYHLNNAERLLEGKVLGAEHLLARGNSIYASLHNGNIVRIDGDHVTFITQFGKPCKYPEEESICGRPLGMVFDTLNTDVLLVADAYYGIWELNLNNGKKTQLVSPQLSIGVKVSRPAKTFNSLAVAKNGDIYFTDSTSDFGMDNGAMSFFANPSGRLIHYARKTGKVVVLIDNLYFANGVVLSPNENFLLVAETHGSRIQRYWLDGNKKGQQEMFIEGLPGTPDNITPDEDGIWIALVVSADPLHPMLPQSTTRLPLVRKFLLRLLHLLEMPFNFINNLYPNSITQSVVYKIGGFSAFKLLYPPRTTIVRMDWNGKIIGSLHGFDHSVHTVSHVLEFGDYLYLGSPFNNYIGRVKFINKEKIHPVKQVKREIPATQAPITTEAPTTTTKAPTTTQTPPSTTKAPTTTQAPPPTTQAPPPTTQAPPPTTTKAPPTTTTTKAPPTTQAPPKTTQAPPKTTQAPPKTTQAPPKTTQAPPPTTKAAPATTQTPPPTTQAPPPTTQAPPKTTQAPAPTTKAPEKPKEEPKPAKVAEPAPIHEKVKDSPPPTQEPLKVIKKDGPAKL